MSVIEEFRKLMLLSDGALFLVEFELWNRGTKMGFRWSREGSRTQSAFPIYMREIGMGKDVNFKDGL